MALEWNDGTGTAMLKYGHVEFRIVDHDDYYLPEVRLDGVPVWEDDLADHSQVRTVEDTKLRAEAVYAASAGAWVAADIGAEVLARQGCG